MGRIRRHGAVIVAIGTCHLLAYAQIGRSHRPPPPAEDLEMLTYQLWAYICLSVVSLGLASWTWGLVLDACNAAALAWKSLTIKRNFIPDAPRLAPPPLPDNILYFPRPTQDLERWSRVRGADFDISYMQFDSDVVIEYSGPADTLRALEHLPNPLYKANR